MKLEYHNGVRKTKFIHEMTSFEAAIQNYEKMAKDYYAKTKDHTLTDKQRQEECKRALEHLEQERAKINTLADI